MMRRFVLALLPLAGVALGVLVAALGGPVPAEAPLPIGGVALAAAVLGGLALAGAALRLAAPGDRARRPTRRGTPIPRSRRPASGTTDPPTLSGYWRALDEPDWPEGVVRRERVSEEEPVEAAR